MSDGGKGSKPRPFSVSNEEYAARWDAIFGRDDAKQVKEFFDNGRKLARQIDKEEAERNGQAKLSRS